MRVYEGKRSADGRVAVTVISDGRRRPLPTRLDLFNHSPSGFEYGYHGSGPAQLALAILADHFKHTPGDKLLAKKIAKYDQEEFSGDDLAVRIHQYFKRTAIANIPQNASWTMTTNDVTDYLRKLVEADAEVRS